jgi:glycosyltransferase involved in cell wall biosynthesis
VNQHIWDELSVLSKPLIRLDIVGQRWSGLRFRPLFLLLKTANSLLLLARMAWLGFRPGRKVLYISTAGGYGQLFELPFLAIARLLRAHIWYHHHSFQYLEKQQLLTRCSFHIAGSNAHHITLCSTMRERLSQRYGVRRKQSRVLSNSGLINLPTPRPAIIRTRLRTLGFLSNVSFEKGIREFVELCEALQRRNIDFQARVAGPCNSPKVKQFLRDATHRLAQLEYIGPCYDENKTEFFDSIDVFVFPSQYRNEAEPLVIHEANSRGVHVIASSRGCIRELLRSGGGEIISKSPFAKQAQQRIEYLQHHPAEVESNSIAAINAMQRRGRTSRDSLRMLLGELLP